MLPCYCRRKDRAAGREREGSKGDKGKEELRSFLRKGVAIANFNGL